MHSTEREIWLGAVHEAGHVVMNYHHGLACASLTVFPDGTGEIVGGGLPVFDLVVRVECSLGGPAAESLAGSPGQKPDSSLISMAVDQVESGEEPEVLDDYYKAVRATLYANPDWDEERILEFMQSAYQTCMTTLQARWSQVVDLARLAVATPGEPVFRPQIESVLADLKAPRRRT